MKKKIFRFTSPLSRMVLMPLFLLGMFVFMTSSVNAQTFKSVDEASLAVKTELQELLPLSPNPTTLDLKQKAANARVLNMFSSALTGAATTQSAYEVVETKINALSGGGKATERGDKATMSLFTNAKAELLSLITS